MIDWLRRMITGRPSVSPEEREEVLAYYIDSLKVTGLQEREADRYNSVLMQHMNHINEPESAAVLVDASRRLSLCGKELRRRNVARDNIPELAAADYAAWTLVYDDYSAWADASHDAMVTVAEGRTPVDWRVKELFEKSEKQRERAEKDGKRLLELIGVKTPDAQRIRVAGERAMAEAEWEPQGED